MKKILFYGIAFTMSVLIMTSCEDDLGGGIITNDPEIALDLTNTELNPIPGQVFSVTVQTAKGDDPLQAFTVQADGNTIDNSRITINGVSAAANPILVVSPDTDGFTWTVDIVSHSDPEVVSYSFIISDTGGKSATTSVDISTIPEVITPATLTLGGNLMYMGSPGNKVTIPVSTLAGTYLLKAIAVLDEDANPLDVADIYYGDTQTNFTSNPMDIEGDDRFGFDVDIYITAHNGGLKNYTIALEDESGDIQFVDFTINAGLSVNFLQGILFNAAGPAGTGGLDLDDGISVGSNDPTAEIKDEGIDLDEPMDLNWIRRISGVNGSEVKQLVPNMNGLPESFTFEDVFTPDQIAAVWDNATDFLDSNDAGERISFRVGIGDLFIVENSGKYYMIKVVEINETTDSNGDNYVIDIKH